MGLDEVDLGLFDVYLGPICLGRFMETCFRSSITWTSPDGARLDGACEVMQHPKPYASTEGQHQEVPWQSGTRT